MYAPDFVRQNLRVVPDFPKPGIVFKDLNPVLAQPEGLSLISEWMAQAILKNVDLGDGPPLVAGVESRGFIYGSALAHQLVCGYVPIRKPGKTPPPVHRVTYDLEYGTDVLELGQNLIPAGKKVILVDDVLATGGTAEAAVKLLRDAGAEVVMALFVWEIPFLKGAQRLEKLGVPFLCVARDE